MLLKRIKQIGTFRNTQKKGVLQFEVHPFLFTVPAYNIQKGFLLLFPA